MILDKYTLLEVRAELSKLPIDKDRCRILLLPEQAWEEAQDQCIHAVEALAAEQPEQNPAPQVALTGNRNATDLSAPAAAGPQTAAGQASKAGAPNGRAAREQSNGRASQESVLDTEPAPAAASATAKHYWQQEFYRVEKMVEAEQDRVEELERQLAAAKEAIEDAPHAEYCGVPSSSGAEVYECRCWKAEALSKLGVDREGKL